MKSHPHATVDDMADEYEETEFVFQNRHGQSMTGILCLAAATTTGWRGKEQDVILLNHGLLGHLIPFDAS
jgi:hypothetical protein